jgi:uncharacterized protein
VKKQLVSKTAVSAKMSEGPSRTASMVQIAFLLLVLGIVIGLWGQAALKTLALTFGAIIIEALPFIALGALISGLIEVYIPRERIAKLFSSHWSSVLLGAGLGLIFPVCECAIVPVVRRLFRKGIPMGAGIAFLLGGPIVNPLVAMSTAVAYPGNWLMVLLRLGGGYIIACSAAWLLDRLLSKHDLLLANQNKVSECDQDVAKYKHTHTEKIKHGIQHAWHDFYDVGRFFVVGAFLAALIQTFLARHTMAQYLLTSPVAAILMMMVLAFLLNLCSEADAFVAASFQSALVPISGQLSFLLLGPMLDVKLIIMYMGLFKKKAIAKIATLVFLLVFGSMLLLEWLL